MGSDECLSRRRVIGRREGQITSRMLKDSRVRESVGKNFLASENEGHEAGIAPRTELTLHYYSAIDELLSFDCNALCHEDPFFQIPHRRVRGDIFIDLVLAVEWTNDVFSIRRRGGTCRRGHGY